MPNIRAEVEFEAKVVEMGLWRDLEQTPPWEFRHKP